MPLNISDERLNQWANDPQVSIEIAKEIEKQYFKENRFLILAGNNKSRGIILRKRNDLSPFRERMKTALTGKGVMGNTDLSANRDRLEFLTTEIRAELPANSVLSDVLVYHRTRNVDFIKEASDSLSDWMDKQVEKMMSASLVNNFSNVVLADATKGYKDSAKKGTSVKDYAKTLTKGDVLKVATIRKAISMAKNGTTYDGSAGFVVKPLSVEVVSQKGFSYKDEIYVLFVNNIQAEQLRADAEWKEMQKIDKRGDTNRLFTGAIGAIDNCVVIEVSEWLNESVTGLPSSDFDQRLFNQYVQNAKPMNLQDYKGKDTETCLGVLMGAGALVFGSNETPKVYIQEQDDGRKMSVGIDKIVAIAKTRYDVIGSFNNNYNEAKDSPAYALDGKDFSVIGILSSKE